MNLLHHINFNENDTVTVHDYSTNNLHSITATGLTIVAAERGMAGSFDGTANNLNFGNIASVSATNRLTLFAKIKLNSLTSRNDIINKDGQYALRINATTGLIVFTIWIASTPVELISTTAIVINTWYNIICRYDGAFMKIFLNGVEDGSGAETGSIDASTANLYYGRYSDYYMNGLIEVGEIRNTAITNAQVTVLNDNPGGLECVCIRNHNFLEGDLIEYENDDGTVKYRGVVSWKKSVTAFLFIPVSTEFNIAVTYIRKGNIFNTARQWTAQIKEYSSKPCLLFKDGINGFGQDVPGAGVVMDLSTMVDGIIKLPNVEITGTMKGNVTKSFYSGVLVGNNADNEIAITGWEEENYRILLYDDVNLQDALGVIKYPDSITPKTKLHLKVFEAVGGNGYVITLIPTSAI